MIYREGDTHRELYRQSCIENNRERSRVDSREKSRTCDRITCIHRDNYRETNREYNRLRGNI